MRIAEPKGRHRTELQGTGNRVNKSPTVPSSRVNALAHEGVLEHDRRYLTPGPGCRGNDKAKAAAMTGAPSTLDHRLWCARGNATTLMQQRRAGEVASWHRCNGNDGVRHPPSSTPFVVVSDESRTRYAWVESPRGAAASRRARGSIDTSTRWRC